VYTSIQILRPDGVKILGRLWTGSSELVIFVPGFLADQYSQGKFDRWAWYLHQKNMSILTFDFEGCGDSPVKLMTLPGALEDIAAVCRWAQNQNFNQLHLMGYGLGATFCLNEMIQKDIFGKVAFIGGVTSSWSNAWTEILNAEHMRQLNETGTFWIHNPHHMNRNFLCVDSSVLSLFSNVPKESKLSLITAPIIMIHGDADDEERRLCECSRKILGYLPEESYIHVIHGASHSFWGQIDAVGKKLQEWFMPAHASYF
jgi:alpha/beta superfamily hydrolase